MVDANEGDKFITVKELIEMLNKVDPNLSVYVEGCDCEGHAKDVIPWIGGIMITRIHGNKDGWS